MFRLNLLPEGHEIKKVFLTGEPSQNEGPLTAAIRFLLIGRIEGVGDYHHMSACKLMKFLGLPFAECHNFIKGKLKPEHQPVFSAGRGYLRVIVPTMKFQNALFPESKKNYRQRFQILLGRDDDIGIYLEKNVQMQDSSIDESKDSPDKGNSHQCIQAVEINAVHDDCL